jgi:serine/threonine-protein kinase
MKKRSPTSQFGRYRLEKLLNRGGMGEIYLALTEGPGGFKKRVVIKKLMSHLAQDEDFITRFIDEANIVVHLTHGNIVPVFDMGEVDGEYFIAMEYIPGRDLRDVLRRYRKSERLPSLSIGAYLLRETARGLSYAHNKTDESGISLGIIHRDISPSNILVSREGIVKLTDFGIAKAMSRLGRSITGRLQGKFCYMSPEQASGQSVDHLSDVFSLGAVSYELFTGIRPFERETDLATLECVKSAKFDPPSLHRPELPQSINDAICRALAKDPSERFQEVMMLGESIVKGLGNIKQANELDMSKELISLYGKTVERLHILEEGSGMNFDDLLSLQTDEALQLTPGKNPTRTATSAMLTPSSHARPHPLITPTPIIQLTPTPYGLFSPQNSKRTLRRTGLIAGVALSLLAWGLWGSSGLLRNAQINVSCSEPLAEIFVDNHFEGMCPINIDTRPGTVQIRAHLTGFHPTTQELILRRGQVESLFISLDPIQIESFPVIIRLIPPGRFSLDGGQNWFQSGEATPVSAGTREVLLEVNNQLHLEQVTFSPQDTAVDLTFPSTVMEENVLDAHISTNPDSFSFIIRVSVSPEAAQIYLDGVLTGTGSQELELQRDHATYSIHAELDGYNSESTNYNPTEDNRRRIRLTLEASPEPRLVQFQLTYPGSGQIEIDGVNHGDAPIAIPLSLGLYTVRVFNTLTGHEEQRVVEVSEGEGLQVEPFFQNTENH